MVGIRSPTCPLVLLPGVFLKQGKVLQRAGFHELSALPGLSGPC